jgi:hypothetical protein
METTISSIPNVVTRALALLSSVISELADQTTSWAFVVMVFAFVSGVLTNIWIVVFGGPLAAFAGHVLDRLIGKELQEPPAEAGNEADGAVTEVAAASKEVEADKEEDDQDTDEEDEDEGKREKEGEEEGEYSEPENEDDRQIFEREYVCTFHGNRACWCSKRIERRELWHMLEEEDEEEKRILQEEQAECEYEEEED